MFKKLLVAVVVLTLLIGLFSPAMATKSPNEARKLSHALPPGAWRSLATPTNDLPSGNPATTPTKSVTPPGMIATKPAAPCVNVSCVGALAYYWDNVPGAAMKYTAGGDCTLKTFTMDLYSGGATPAAAGITMYVWYDNGLGLPGSVITSVNVPHGSIVYYPSAMVFNLGNITVANADVHLGYIENDFTDSYRPLSDAGGTGDCSRYYDNVTAAWYTMIVATGLDYNWSMSLNICCVSGGGQDCHADIWDNGVYYRWGGKAPKAVRFSAANECTLLAVKLGFSSGGQVGTGGVDVKVLADNSGLPGAQIGSTVHVPHGSMVIPGMTVVDMTGAGIPPLTGDYHVACYITNPATDDYQLRSDDGTGGNGRSTYDTSEALQLGWWASNAVIFAPDDYNWLIQDSVCCSTAPPICAWDDNGVGAATYYWPIPDAYGDDFFNMRFSFATKCTLKTLEMAFYQAASVGAPGATIYLWNSDGTFPTTVVNSWPVNPVANWFPAYESVDISGLNYVVKGERHVGYSPIYNDPSDVLSILSDNGVSGTLRGSEWWGQWGLMNDDWGIDAGFLIKVYRCCQPEGYCEYVCDPNDQWPTWGHDYSRKSQSGLTLGDVCGVINVWTFSGPAGRGPNFTSPVIADDRVYIAFDNRISCVNLLTGIPIWESNTIPAWATLIISGLRDMPTVEGGYIYTGTGSTRGYVKADAATGAVIWARGSTSVPLPGTPGNTRYAPNIIMGNEIYFGDDNGQIYALDATTGANLYFAKLWGNPPTNTLVGSVYTSPSTDGTHLFFGLGIGFVTGGCVSAVTPGGAFTPFWDYVDPFQATLGTGFVASPTYACENLFVNSYMSVDQGGYKGYRQNLDPLTGIPKWPDFYLMGQSWSGPPAVIGGLKPLAVFANMNNGASGSVFSRGVRAVTFGNSTKWINPGTTGVYDNNLFCHASVTCDPYVIYGTADQANGDGHWRIADGTDGTILVDYYLTGFVMGTALAHGSDGNNWMVMALRMSAYGAGPGKLFGFKVGPPRPRMYIPELAVEFAPTSTSDPQYIYRDDASAIENIGCAVLTYNATLEAGNPAKARISSVSTPLKKTADALMGSMVEYRVDDLLSRTTPSKTKMIDASMALDENEDVYMSTLAVKPAAATSSALLPPTWVAWNPPSTGAGAIPGPGSEDFHFTLDRFGMQLLGSNYWYVDIVSNDPDYNLEDPLAVPQVYITYTIPYVYCVLDTGRMAFGATGGEWYSNRGEIGDGNNVLDFTLDGSDDFLYEGSMFFMTSMNTAAWNPFGSSVPHDFGFLFPFYITGTTCGSCQYNTPLPVEYTINGGVSYNNTVGDLCTFAMIDSGQTFGQWPHQTGPSMGILVKYREVGTYGADFGAFKLIVADIYNRSTIDPINGLYFGVFADWDIGTDIGGGNMDKGYIYIDDGAGTARGEIGLPQKGSYWPDGTKTDPMYNGRINDNAVEVYPPAEYPLDSLFSWIDSRPEGDLYAHPAGAGDKSHEAAFGKVDLAASGVKTFGFAIFGVNGSASVNADVEDIAAFANKYAGFARGDVNNDGIIDLRDLVRLQRYVSALGPGPEPFKHLGDVNNDLVVDGLDCTYLAAYFFTGGPPPKCVFMF